MRLHSIETFEELITFVPALIRVKQDVIGACAVLDKQNMVAEITRRFKPKNHFLGELDENDELDYFICVCEVDEDTVEMWAIYAKKELRTSVNEVLRTVVHSLQACHYNEILIESSNMKTACRRWLEKLGAKPETIKYGIKLC